MADPGNTVRELLRAPSGNETVRKVLSALTAMSALFIAAICFSAVTMGSIKGGEIGIHINNLTGTVSKIDPGTCFYFSLVSDLYVLDRSQQTVEMKREAVKRPGADPTSETGDVKIKTIDGSDVAADIVVNYTIDPERAVEIALQSGLADAYKEKWVTDYARAVSRNVLGELTTEQFYDSQQRDAKSDQAELQLNTELDRWGIKVTAVQVQDFSFYKEYEDKIREKKLADQEVEEQKSQAKAATERQKRIRIEEENKVAVEVARFEGEMEQKLLAAKAQADKAKKAAEAYLYSTKVGADARFYSNEKKAQAILAKTQAEAEGMARMAKALEGGRNLVLIEYAQRLGTMRISGQPYLIDARTERLQHSGETGGAAPMKGAAAAPSRDPESPDDDELAIELEVQR